MLTELRSVLLLEHEWRLAEGLVSHAPPVAEQPTEACHSRQ